MLICPVCGDPLVLEEKTWQCRKGHRFDMAKEGYVNLLRTNKSGDKMLPLFLKERFTYGLVFQMA